MCNNVNSNLCLVSTQYMLHIIIIVITNIINSFKQFINTYNLLQNLLGTVPAPQNYDLTYTSTKLTRVFMTIGSYHIDLHCKVFLKLIFCIVWKASPILKYRAQSLNSKNLVWYGNPTLAMAGLNNSWTIAWQLGGNSSLF